MVPEQIKTGAFHSSTGEYAWQRPRVADAIEALTNNGYVILGGEVWVIENSMILAAPPLRSGGSSVIGWDTESRKSAEAWGQFALRTAEESLSAIESLNTESEVLPEVADKVYYNLIFVDEAEYSELHGA